MIYFYLSCTQIRMLQYLLNNKLNANLLNNELNITYLNECGLKRWFSSGAFAFQLDEKKVISFGRKKNISIGRRFFHISYFVLFGRIILIHLVHLPLARQMSVAPCSPRGGGSRILKRIFSSWKCHSSFIKSLRLKSYIKCF